MCIRDRVTAEPPSFDRLWCCCCCCCCDDLASRFLATLALSLCSTTNLLMLWVVKPDVSWRQRTPLVHRVTRGTIIRYDTISWEVSLIYSTVPYTEKKMEETKKYKISEVSEAIGQEALKKKKKACNRWMTLTYNQGHWPWLYVKVITVAAIKWLYGISLRVCGLLFQSLYRPVFKTLHYHFWSERDCLWPCNENSFIFDNEA